MGTAPPILQEREKMEKLDDGRKLEANSLINPKALQISNSCI